MKNSPQELLDYLKELGFTFSRLGISVLNLEDMDEIRRAIKKRMDDEFTRGMDKVFDARKEL